MEVRSVKDFFHKQISMTSVLMPEDCKLTNTEINFLVECCVYHYNGNDLNDLKGLSKYLIDKKFFTVKERVSLYKYKLSTKKWVRSKNGLFTLPKGLDKRDGDDLYFNFELKCTNEDISDRQDLK